MRKTTTKLLAFPKEKSRNKYFAALRPKQQSQRFAIDDYPTAKNLPQKLTWPPQMLGFLVVRVFHSPPRSLTLSRLSIYLLRLSPLPSLCRWPRFFTLRVLSLSLSPSLSIYISIFLSHSLSLSSRTISLSLTICPSLSLSLFLLLAFFNIVEIVVGMNF
jgi:hypothetical protein